VGKRSKSSHIELSVHRTAPAWWARPSVALALSSPWWIMGAVAAEPPADTPKLTTKDFIQGSVPPLAEQLKPEQSTAKNTPDSALPDAAAMPKELGKPTDDMTLDVSAYTVDDTAPVALKEALPGLTAAFVGPQRSYEDLVNAAAAVTRFMQRELGYYLAYAYLPAQKPTNGQVRIAVLEGRLDQVIVQWPDKLPVDKEVIEGFLSRLKPGDILKVRDVERTVFTVNDLYGIRARFEVKAGRYPGTASLLVTPQAERRLTGRVEFDVNGSKYSGPNRLTGIAAYASPTGRGDNLSASVLLSTTGGLKFGLVSYSAPLGTDGLKVGASLSTVSYQLDQKLIPLNLHGKADTISLFGLYPVVRSRNLNVFTQGTIESKTFDDTLAGILTSKKSSNLQLGLVGDFRDNFLTGGVNTYEVSWLAGRLTSDNATLLVPKSFDKFTLGYSRLQNIISGRLLAYGRYKGQISRKNLDTTERFGVGGASGVRAFGAGEGAADDAHLMTGELRWLPPETLLGRNAREMAFSVFYDLGVAWLEHDPSTGHSVETRNRIALGGYGLGYVWDRPQSFGFRMSVAWPTYGKYLNDTPARSPRVFAGFSKSL
jgi:hemolysin activation/secretion protein